MVRGVLSLTARFGTTQRPSARGRHSLRGVAKLYVKQICIESFSTRIRYHAHNPASSMKLVGRSRNSVRLEQKMYLISTNDLSPGPPAPSCYSSLHLSPCVYDDWAMGRVRPQTDRHLDILSAGWEPHWHTDFVDDAVFLAVETSGDIV